MSSVDQYKVLQTGAGVLRRVDRGHLLLRGEDRRSYLHGLLTNDIASLPPGGGCYAALLTVQGRMIADMRVFELGEIILLDLDTSLVTSIREHLDTFVITEDVVIEDATGSRAQVGVYGPKAADALASTLKAGAAVGESHPDVMTLDAMGPFANGTWDFDGAAAIVLRTHDSGVAGFEVVVPDDRVERLVKALEIAGGVAVGPEALEVTRIEAGIPRFLVDMDTATIPLEAGIEDRAISMTKGCYVGQEVIIRVLHRGGGRVAKKLVRLRTSVPVAREDHLLRGGREVGRITSAAVSPTLGPVALAYVQRELVEPGTELTVQIAEGQAAARVAPPSA